MSPEQVLGQEVDHRSDIFALGSVLHEMLTGARAFQRPTAVETMSAVLREDPPDLLAVNPSTPPGAAAAVRRCLEKSPDERFQSARDLAFHLQQLGSRRPAHPLPAAHAAAARPAPSRGRRPAAAPPVPPPAPPLPAAHVPPRPHRRGVRFTDAGVYSQTRGSSRRRCPHPQQPRGTRSTRRPRSSFCAGAALSIGRRFVKGERSPARWLGPSGGGSLPGLDDIEDVTAPRLAFAVVPGDSAESTLEYPVWKVLHGRLSAQLRSRATGVRGSVDDLPGSARAPQ
jgi:hypothetical protein